MLEEQVAALAQGRGSGNIDHGEDDHRRDRFQHVSRFFRDSRIRYFVLLEYVHLSAVLHVLQRQALA